MPQIINTNIASLTAQRNLNSSQNSLNTSLQRLSSGLRINSAKDDAAGLAISERFTTQIRGLNQASRNANDAISLSQTAEGALGEIGNNLQRIRELAVQSANATNSSSDRAALDLEVQQRLAEVDRIAGQTSFNGQKIIDGSFGTAAFQVGANVGETIALDLTTSMRKDQLGAYTDSKSVDLTTVIADGTAAVAGSYTSGQLDSLDFSTTGVTATTGTSTIAVSTAAVAGDTITVDGVVFTFAQGGASGTTVSAGAVTITEDMATTALTADTTAAALRDAIIDYKASGTASTDELDDITATASTNTVTLTYATAGLPSTNSHTISAATGTLATTNTVDASGVDEVITSNLGFSVDGNAVAVSTDYTGNQAGLITEIQADLNANANGVYVVAAEGASGFSITTAVAGATNPAAVTAFTTNSIANDDGGTVVAGADLVAAATVTVADDFSIQIGTSDAVNVANATYSTTQSLVDAVNTALAGNGEAVLNDDNTMSIIANEDVTVTGNTGLTTLGYTGTVAASGDLTTAKVTTVADSNDAIRRIDASLTSISDLRSTFGAIQNRFESTISNLNTAVESLSAARSRIQDADFASETAALTRAQILQQAGVSILSQANSLPQSVLGLLQ